MGAKPMAAEKWAVLVPDGPMSVRLKPSSSQRSLAQSGHMRLGEGRHDGEIEAVEGKPLGSRGGGGRGRQACVRSRGQ